MKELFEKLNKLNEKQKKEIEKNKNRAKEFIDNAEKGCIILTDKDNALVGSKPTLMSLTTILIKKLLDNNVINEKELDKMIETAKLSDEELNDRAKDKMEKLKEFLDMFKED